jgi:hypothetical protein
MFCGQNWRGPGKVGFNCDTQWTHTVKELNINLKSGWDSSQGPNFASSGHEDQNALALSELGHPEAEVRDRVTDDNRRRAMGCPTYH